MPTPTSNRPAPTIALVINTYNQADYLARVLTAVGRQTLLPTEVILADDGSDAATGQAFADWKAQQRVAGEHVWQERSGFRRSRILNRAIARTRSPYLIFLDGDTVPHPRFLEDHAGLGRRGTYVQGHRAFIEQSAARYFGCGTFGQDRWRALRTGQLQGWKHAFRWPRPWVRERAHLHGTRGCNLAIWRSDLVAVNGYNEAFEGWGREDSELVLRLMNQGVRRRDVRGWALCYHLWHPPADRSQLPQNDALLEQTRAQRLARCERGLDQYLTARGAGGEDRRGPSPASSASKD